MVEVCHVAPSRCHTDNRRCRQRNPLLPRNNHGGYLLNDEDISSAYAEDLVIDLVVHISDIDNDDLQVIMRRERIPFGQILHMGSVGIFVRSNSRRKLSYEHTVQNHG